MGDIRKWVIGAAALLIGLHIYSILIDFLKSESMLSEVPGILSMVILIILMVVSLKQNPDL
jgi:hypothetical protein